MLSGLDRFPMVDMWVVQPLSLFFFFFFSRRQKRKWKEETGIENRWERDRRYLREKLTNMERRIF